MPKKYCRILEEVEAVQATIHNLEELRIFAGDVKKVPHISESMLRITCYYIIPGVDEVLWAGDFLIKHPSGRLEVKSRQLFHREYEPK